MNAITVASAAATSGVTSTPARVFSTQIKIVVAAPAIPAAATFGRGRAELLLVEGELLMCSPFSLPNVP